MTGVTNKLVVDSIRGLRDVITMYQGSIIGEDMEGWTDIEFPTLHHATTFMEGLYFTYRNAAKLVSVLPYDTKGVFSRSVQVSLPFIFGECPLDNPISNKEHGRH
jgi:hypothetical protein